ncbi:hypothetical protein GLAREA_10940 [Glarea lozoyensis ATCC 20868]|uniref:Uncharacterized protein n=1 Tax=Glarea lozoyensis (strain ATCC 20868 / MF5171) TaxID=1116229 RepID=S3EA95_GLAL2|nr:uncharacterized protein GLAREA_10940 [Glarea lozoyensis ATCC 20868]EPE35243.1 hypothetical protein GLAREA_10940 [Glarea lozoyensis ATCC 20868]
MQFTSTVLVALLTSLTLAAPQKNSKLNQYATIDDCNNDRNILFHASPSEGSCHGVDGKTGALYLVTGDGAAGAYFVSKTTGDCKGDGPTLAQGTCISPNGAGSIEFVRPI